MEQRISGTPSNGQMASSPVRTDDRAPLVSAVLSFTDIMAAIETAMIEPPQTGTWLDDDAPPVSFEHTDTSDEPNTENLLRMSGTSVHVDHSALLTPSSLPNEESTDITPLASYPSRAIDQVATIGAAVIEQPLPDGGLEDDVRIMSVDHPEKPDDPNTDTLRRMNRSSVDVGRSPRLTPDLLGIANEEHGDITPVTGDASRAIDQMATTGTAVIELPLPDGRLDDDVLIISVDHSYRPDRPNTYTLRRMNGTSVHVDQSALLTPDLLGLTKEEHGVVTPLTGDASLTDAPPDSIAGSQQPVGTYEPPEPRYLSFSKEARVVDRISPNPAPRYPFAETSERQTDRTYTLTPFSKVAFAMDEHEDVGMRRNFAAVSSAAHAESKLSGIIHRITSETVSNEQIGKGNAGEAAFRRRAPQQKVEVRAIEPSGSTRRNASSVPYESHSVPTGVDQRTASRPDKSAVFGHEISGRNANSLTTEPDPKRQNLHLLGGRVLSSEFKVPLDAPPILPATKHLKRQNSGNRFSTECADYDRSQVLPQKGSAMNTKLSTSFVSDVNSGFKVWEASEPTVARPKYREPTRSTERIAAIALESEELATIGVEQVRTFKQILRPKNVAANLPEKPYLLATEELLAKETATVIPTLLTQATSASSQPTLVAPAGNVVRQLAGFIAISQPDSGTTELVLSPEELGKVQFSIRSSEGHLTVLIAAERADTLALLRRNAEVLSADLADLGAGEMTLAFGRKEGSADRERNQPDWNLAPPDRNDELGQADLTTERRTAVRTDGNIDIRL